MSVLKHYHDWSFIGNGTFGTVYKANFQTNGKNYKSVAIKIAKPRHRLGIFPRKIQGKHIPNVLHIIEVLRIQKTDVIIMDFYNSSLRIKIDDASSMNSSTAVVRVIDVMLQIINGIQHMRKVLNNSNITHCDIKPTNILHYITAQGKDYYLLADLHSVSDEVGTCRNRATFEYRSSARLSNDHNNVDIFQIGPIATLGIEALLAWYSNHTRNILMNIVQDIDTQKTLNKMRWRSRDDLYFEHLQFAKNIPEVNRLLSYLLQFSRYSPSNVHLYNFEAFKRGIGKYISE